jgi:hypothetical protein
MCHLSQISLFFRHGIKKSARLSIQIVYTHDYLKDSAMKSVQTLLLAGICLALSACMGVGPVRPVQDSQNALVYGHLQLPGGKKVHQLVMHEYGETYITPFKNPPQAHIDVNGNFFFENVKPGKYYLHRFLGERKMYVMPYRSMAEVDAATFIVKPGNIVYIGSFEVLRSHQDTPGPGNFELRPIDKPGRLAILRHIADSTQGTGWDERIESHISKSLVSKN